MRVSVSPGCPSSFTALLHLFAVPGIGDIIPGSNLSAVIMDCLVQDRMALQDGDVLCICSKIVSKAEGRFVDLQTIVPSAEADALARETEKDPRLVELILRESNAVSRKRSGALIVRHRLGFISANAAIDASNAVPFDAPAGSGPWVLLLPEDPDRSAQLLRDKLESQSAARLGVVITDSLGRPFRVGSVGAAIGLAGIPAVWDQRGGVDRDGRTLEVTITGFADQVAAAADLVAGQGDEGTPVVVVRGLTWPDALEVSSAKQLVRDPETDLYA